MTLTWDEPLLEPKLHAGRLSNIKEWAWGLLVWRGKSARHCQTRAFRPHTNQKNWQEDFALNRNFNTMVADSRTHVSVFPFSPRHCCRWWWTMLLIFCTFMGAFGMKPLIFVKIVTGLPWMDHRRPLGVWGLHSGNHWSITRAPAKNCNTFKSL